MEKENVKWEYKIVISSRLYSSEDNLNPVKGDKRKTFIKESLNDYGDEGWEVCGYECGTYLLKRIKQGKEVKNITDFHKTYCDSCGSQRCDRSEEWMDACPHYIEWKGM